VNDGFELPDIPDLATHPHDALFKHVFSQLDYASDCFRNHLPAEVVRLIRFEELALVPGSFVKTSLKQSHSDLLFSAPIVTSEGEREILLHLVFEHQTTVDPTMPLRILGYKLEIWQRHEREHGLPLPPVMGLVLHQGPDEWTVSTRFSDLFDLPAEAAETLLPYLPQFRHALLDLSQFDPANGDNDERVKVVLQLMKLARKKQALEFFAWLVEVLPTLPANLPDPLVTVALLYALSADNSLDIEAIANTVRDKKTISEITMNAIEKLRAEGEAKGKAEGKAEGKATGIWIGKVQVMQEFLKLSEPTQDELSALSVGELEALYHELQVRYDASFKG
jgi:predicted transposase/invertase (TIGR01784 family)